MAVDVIQCVPNFSEGRDAAVVAALCDAVRSTPGVALADWSADPDHHRCVLTLLGEAGPVAAAAMAAARVAVARIDLTRHRGAHPRMGALDVLPFVPYGATPMDACVRLATQVGQRLAEELALPVYLYEEAASRPERRLLSQVRGKGFEAMRDAPLDGDRQPDFGPRQVHPTAGAVAVGARGPLLAYNITLDTDDVSIARAVAAKVRERGGGLPGVRALGLELPGQRQIQVSMNITRPAEAPLHRVFELVRLEAAAYGVAVTGSELIGAIRLEELAEVARHCLGLRGLKSSQVLDLHAAALLGVDGGRGGSGPAPGSAPTAEALGTPE